MGEKKGGEKGRTRVKWDETLEIGNKNKKIREDRKGNVGKRWRKKENKVKWGRNDGKGNETGKIGR